MEKKKETISLVFDIIYLTMLFISSIFLILYARDISGNTEVNKANIFEFTNVYIVFTLLLIIINIVFILFKKNTNMVRCVKLFTIAVFAYLLSSSLVARDIVNKINNNICSGLAIIVLVGELILFFTDITNKEMYQIVLLILSNSCLVLDCNVDNTYMKVALILTIVAITSYLIKLILIIYTKNVNVKKDKVLLAQDRA
jgi:hypothetical protein